MLANPKPHRRIEGEIFIGADNWDEFCAVISDIQKEVEQAKQADENLYWVSAGDNAAASLSIAVDHFMTRECYLADLQNCIGRKAEQK